MSDFNTSRDEAFFAAIGRLAISWAHLETGVTSMVQVMHSVSCDDTKDYKSILNGSMSRKIKYIRTASEGLGLDDTSTASFSSFLKKLSEARDRRNSIFHGPIIAYSEGHGRASFARIGKKERNILPQSFSMQTRDILEAAIKIGELSDRAFSFVEKFHSFLCKNCDLPQSESSK